MKKVLSIAGSDCSGGAGIQADLKTFSAHGVFGMSVIVSVVAENTSRVIDIQDITPDMIEKQIDAVFEDIEVDAVKIGMLSTPECMKAVAKKLLQYKPQNVVIDPVMYAKNGCPLMNPTAVSTLIDTVIPLADVLTPNIPEAEKIADMQISTVSDMEAAARKIYAMVSISIRKPVKIAAGISPIEAVRFTPVQKDIRSRKKNIKLNPVSMGIANFKRDRKKTISIIASLSLGGIILLVVSSMVLLRSPEALARQIYPYGDYKIYLHSELAVEEAMAAGNPLNEKLKQEILAIDGVTDVITKRQSLHINYRANGIDEAGWCDILTEQNYSAVEAALIEGTMPADAHSIIIDSHTSNRDNIRVGETVEVTSGKSTIPVTISGVFDNDSIPTDGHGTVPVDSPLEFATEALFHELHPEIASFDYSWNIASDPKKADNVESELKNIVATHTDIALENIDTIIEYEKNINSFVFGSMEVLSWLVFLFGVINLINTTLSNQMSRKQENSVLRSIGLTQKQLCKMNICEGLCYAFFATLATLIVGLPASIFACSKFSVGAFAGKVVPYKFPVLEMGLFILVLFGMELILSVWTIRRQKKQSLIEQMRAME